MRVAAYAWISPRSTILEKKREAEVERERKGRGRDDLAGDWSFPSFVKERDERPRLRAFLTFKFSSDDKKGSRSTCPVQIANVISHKVDEGNPSKTRRPTP